jgi:hypothetical protein
MDECHTSAFGLEGRTHPVQEISTNAEVISSRANLLGARQGRAGILNGAIMAERVISLGRTGVFISQWWLVTGSLVVEGTSVLCKYICTRLNTLEQSRLLRKLCIERQLGSARYSQGVQVRSQRGAFLVAARTFALPGPVVRVAGNAKRSPSRRPVHRSTPTKRAQPGDKAGLREGCGLLVLGTRTLSAVAQRL